MPNKAMVKKEGHKVKKLMKGMALVAATYGAKKLYDASKKAQRNGQT